MPYGNARLLVLLGVLLLSTTASADEIEKKFRAFDANGNGAIEWSEHEADALKAYQAMDADHDGRVGPGEYFEWSMKESAALDEPPNGGSAEGARFLATVAIKAWDRDGNGTLSQAELKAAADASFQRGDTDHDKRMTLKEMQAASRPSAPSPR